jgi:hypothetical protein
MPGRRESQPATLRRLISACHAAIGRSFDAEALNHGAIAFIFVDGGFCEAATQKNKGRGPIEKERHAKP